MSHDLKSMSKILFVSDVSIENVDGGAERVLFEQSTRLAKRGHSIHILTRKLPEHKKNRVTIHGVKEWRYRLNYHSNDFKFFFDTYFYGRKLFNYLQKKYRFSAINFHQPISSFAVISSPLSHTTNKFYTCHSLSFEEFAIRNSKNKTLLNRSFHLFHIIIRKWLEKKVLNDSDKIIVLSQYTKNKLKNLYHIDSKNVSIIPGGVDLKRFYPFLKKNQIRRSFGIPGNKFILFTVRNLVPRMGLENLIIALKDIVNKAPDIFLIIGGEGPLKHKLEQLSLKLDLNRFIKFVGFIPEKELPKYYQLADLFVLPTKDLEGFGMVTLEALASGLPVLGTPIGGTQEILERFEPEFLFKNTDSHSISHLTIKKYIKAKQDPQWWKDVSMRCRSFVEENYTWKQNIDSLEEMLVQSSS